MNMLSTTASLLLPDGTTVFSPADSPVYGGGYIVATLPLDVVLSAVGKFYFVFEGTSQRHITPAVQQDAQNLQSVIPGHSLEEVVNVSILSYDDSGLTLLGQGSFQYYYDSVFYMAEFLINCVYNPCAINEPELIKSEHFDLANEETSTLDDKLSRAFLNYQYPPQWDLLGSDYTLEPRETLLHFAARLGLGQLARVLLEKPGSGIALQIPDKHGYTPKEIAAIDGFSGLAELLSEYNSQNCVQTDDSNVENDDTVIHSYSDGCLSVTSSLHSHRRSLVDDISVLEDFYAKNVNNFTTKPSHPFETDWPQRLQSNQGLTDLLMEKKINDVNQHRNALHNQLNELMHKQVDEESVGSDQTDNPRASHDNLHLVGDSDLSCIPCDGSSMEHIQVLEGSLNSVREINESVLRLRENDACSRLTVHRLWRTKHHQHCLLMYGYQMILQPLFSGAASDSSIDSRGTSKKRKLDSDEASNRDRFITPQISQEHYEIYRKDVRKENLARLSCSCPSLDAVGRNRSSTEHINDKDYHASSLDQAEDVGQSHALAGESSSDNHPQYTDDDREPVDASIRICVNGVVVESPEDVQNDIKEIRNNQYNEILKAYFGAQDTYTRRKSWSPEKPVDQKNNKLDIQAMLALNGKSISLRSLAGESEEEDTFVDAKEHQTPRQSKSSFGSYEHHLGTMTGSGFDSENFLASEESKKSPADTEGESHSPSWISNEMGGYKETAARSMSDSQCEMDTSGDSETMWASSNVPGMRTLSTQESDYVDDDNDSLHVTVPHSNMTKSLSTPSIPAATEAAVKRTSERRGGTLNREGQREAKHAMIRRQDEIEEDEEESSLPPASRISLMDFLKDSGNSDSDQDKQKLRKEDKKRRPSVFSRLHNSVRTKKSKEKESKYKSTHQFVSVSFSNSTTCDVCHKSMENKPALRCENCLVNVHENYCKEQITACDKFRRLQVPHSRDATSTVTLKDTQSKSLPSHSTIRPTASVKERSSSAPVRPQMQASHAVHRASLPSNRAINEEGEMEHTAVPGQDLGQSNITEIISESLESLDEKAANTSAEVVDADLEMLQGEEHEAWHVTVDKKILKKMAAKDVKRQDCIWELIQTEKHHCLTLKIMQKVFSEGISQELNMSQECVDKLFPKLDDLIEIHFTFLQTLQQLQKQRPDRSIEEIGSTLITQFSDKSAESMKITYGAFCSGQKESTQLYKNLMSDRKFINFIKRCKNHPLCNKNEIPDLNLLVTQRTTKYPTLIENILKCTKDKKDRENLSRALHLVKELLRDIDDIVDAYKNQERLLEIEMRMDSRHATYKGKKFRKSDILRNNRKLLYECVISCKSARGKVTECQAVILNDLLFFFQESASNQKYAFFTQDGKASVVPLFKLLVREKGDTKDSKGLYLISQNKQEPEMYELACTTTSDRMKLIRTIRTAVEKCQEDDDDIPSESEEEKRQHEARSSKINDIIEQLHSKDEEIKDCCDEKNRLMLELVDLYHGNREDVQSQATRASPKIEENMESSDALQAAIQEVSLVASQLTSMLQSSSSNLSRSVSSVGEHVSTSYHCPPIPKRAETFAGFDSNHDILQKSVFMRKRLPQVKDVETRTPSLQSLNKDSDSDSPSTEKVTEKSRKLSSTSFTKAASMKTQDEPDHRFSDKSSEGGSVGELSGSSVTSLPLPTTQAAPNPSQDQLLSITHLVKYLQNIVHLTSQQITAVESLRAQLAEANERKSQEKKPVLHHNQLEELRNLQENISRERQAWEQQKEKDRRIIEIERAQIEDDRKLIEDQETKIREQKEELKKQRELFQQQIDLLRGQGQLPSNTSVPKQTMSSSSSLDRAKSTEKDHHPAHQAIHRRSASADFQQKLNSYSEQSHKRSKDSKNQLDSGPKMDTRQHRLSAGNLQGVHVNAKQNLPVHLLSATNEKKVGGVKVQHLPMKLAGSGASSSSLRQMLPQRLSATALSQPSSTSSTVSGTASSSSPINSNTRSTPPMKSRANTNPSPSTNPSPDLSLVMKLAEPTQRGRSSSHPIERVSSSPALEMPTQMKQNTQSTAKTVPKQQKPEEVIYF